MHGLDQLVLIETVDGETVQVYDNWFGRVYQIGSAEDCKAMYPANEEECEDAVWRVLMKISEGLACTQNYY